MISYLLFGSSKLLNISDITKRIGNFFKLLILLFILLLIPNSRYYCTQKKKAAVPVKTETAVFIFTHSILRS